MRSQNESLSYGWHDFLIRQIWTKFVIINENFYLSIDAQGTFEPESYLLSLASQIRDNYSHDGPENNKHIVDHEADWNSCKPAYLSTS